MSDKWLKMDVVERATFVATIEKQIDATLAAMLPEALIKEQNSNVRVQAA